MTRPPRIDPYFFCDLQKLGPRKPFSEVRIHNSCQHFSSFLLKKQFHSANDHSIIVMWYKTFAEYRWILSSTYWCYDCGNCMQAGLGFFCFASLWLQKCFLFLLSAAAFCLHVVQVWLPVVFKVVSGTAFSEHGIPMSLNFLRAVLKGPLFVMRHIWTVMLVIFLNKTECIWNIARWTNKLLGEMCTLWNVSYKSVCLFGFFPQKYLYKHDFSLSTNISGSGRDYYQQDWSHWVLVGVRYRGNKGIKLVFLLSKVKVKFLKIFEGRLKSSLGPQILTMLIQPAYSKTPCPRGDPAHFAVFLINKH